MATRNWARFFGEVRSCGSEWCGCGIRSVLFGESRAGLKTYDGRRTRKRGAANPRASSASSNLGVVHVTSKSEALDRLRRKQHEEQVKGVVECRRLLCHTHRHRRVARWAERVARGSLAWEHFPLSSTAM